VVEVNVVAQGASWRFPLCTWVEHVTFQLRGGHYHWAIAAPQDLCTLHIWSEVWKITFNPQKTAVITVSINRNGHFSLYYLIIPTSLKQIHITLWAYCSISLLLSYSHCMLTSPSD